MLYPKEIRNYRDWETIDIDLWRHYWFAMVNRGVMAQPYWWDEQWTISVQHTEADIDKHLSAFDDVAPALAKAQQERMGKWSQWRTNVLCSVGIVRRSSILPCGAERSRETPNNQEPGIVRQRS